MNIFLIIIKLKKIVILYKIVNPYNFSIDPNERLKLYMDK